MSAPQTATLHQHQYGYHYNSHAGIAAQQDLLYRSSSGTTIPNSHVRASNYNDNTNNSTSTATNHTNPSRPSPAQQNYNQQPQPSNSTINTHTNVQTLVRAHQQPQAPSYHQPSQQPSMNPSSASRSSRGDSSTGNKRRRGKNSPDWNEFYRNGLPKEIIVIDDDSPEPDNPPRKYAATGMNGSRTAAGASGASRMALPTQSSASIASIGSAQKRRKIANGGATYEDVYHESYEQSPYSVTQTPTYQNGNGSSANTASTSRGMNNRRTETTATSLTSTQGESAASMAGAKRKRITRGSMAKRETSAFTSYRPPPNPPHKAKNVYVKQIPDAPGPKAKVDDDDGHFIVNENSEITPQYRIMSLLGQGTFGKVVKAYDKKSRKYVAIKVIRSVQKYRDASQIELRVLSTLSSNDKRNRNKCIHLVDCFDYQNHICIVTDLLGMSVFDFLKANSFVPFPSSQIQSFARQLLTSVAFLHDLNLIHTDLKPENILLVHNSFETFTYNRTIPSSSLANPRRAASRKVLLDTDIRLIDFGSATFDDEYHSSVVSTRHYRAPEIILGLGWSFPCDLWSVGCILVEFFTGDALFQTHDNLEHLAMMRTVCGGDIEAKLVRQALNKANSTNNTSTRTFFKGYKLDYPNNETSRTSRRYVKAMKQLDTIIPQNSSFNRQFLDLLKQIFVYDPSRRIRAADALKHQWFNETSRDEGTEAEKIRQQRSHELEERLRRRELGGGSDTEDDLGQEEVNGNETGQ